MPLCLPVQHAYAPPQRVLWDPARYAEAEEARQRIVELIAQGFVVEHEDDGEVALRPPERPANHGLMRVMSQNGDDRVVWDRRVAQQVREAYDKFRELIKRGYRAFAVHRDGSRGHELTEFDPHLEEVLMVPTGSLVPG